MRAKLRVAGGQRTLEGTDILVAAGGTPNTRGIGLEEIGIKLTYRGYIEVNDRLETGVPDTWAIGECAGSPQFTHVSFDDFRVIRDNLGGWTANDQRAARAILHVHRPAPCPNRNERARGA